LSHAAYDAAARWFMMALAKLPVDAARTQHATWLGLVRDAAVCVAATGDVAGCTRLVDAAQGHADDAIERASLQRIVLRAMTNAGRYLDAFALGRRVAIDLGIPIDEPTSMGPLDQEEERTWKMLGAQSDAELLAPVGRIDLLDRVRLEFLNDLATPAWFADSTLVRRLGARSAILASRIGAGGDAAMAFAQYAVALTFDNQRELAARFGRLAVEMASAHQDPTVEGRVLNSTAAVFGLYDKTVDEVIAQLRHAHVQSVRAGDVHFAGYALGNLCFLRYAAGHPLDEVIASCEEALTFFRRIGHSTVAYVNQVGAAARRWKGIGVEGAGPPDTTAEGSPDSLSRAVYDLARLQWAYAFEPGATALERLRESERLKAHLRNLPPSIEHAQYAALVLIDAARGQPATQVAPLLEEASTHLHQLEVWATTGPAIRHKRDLVAAELAAISGRESDALTLYARAIDGAAKNRALADEGLALERSATFAEQRGLSRVAALQLQGAVDAYARWGASAMVERVVERLRVLEPWSSRFHIEVTRRALDHESLARAARTLTSELVLDRLLEKLMRTCLTAVSAERALLVLDEGSVVVRARADKIDVMDLAPVPLAKARDIPTAIVEHVFRTGELLALGDARKDARFAREPSVLGCGARSVLALPLDRGDRRLGVLCLENRLSTDAFPDDRVEILRLLSGEIAIALENSRLYEERERGVRRLQILSDASVRLAEALDYDACLKLVTELFVPDLAEWCLVDLVEEGRFIPAISTHRDPGLRDAVEHLHRRSPIVPESSSVRAEALQTRRGALRELDDAFYRENAGDASHLRLLENLAPRSAIAVPIIVRGRALGLVSLLRSGHCRAYDAADLALAEDLAQRISPAIDNARLFRDLKEAIGRLEQSIAQWEATMNATAEGILVVDRRFEVTGCNARFRELWGLPPSVPARGRYPELLRPMFDQLIEPETFVARLRELEKDPVLESTDMVWFKDGRVYERHSTPQRMGDEISGRVFSVRDVTYQEEQLRRSVFLAEATRLLGSLEAEQALASVAHLVATRRGDDCAVDLFEHGEARRIAGVYRDPSQPLPAVTTATTPTQAMRYADNGSSRIVAPLVVRDETVGAVSIGAPPGVSYLPRDVEAAQDLARRAALSVENSRLYHDAQRALRIRDEFLSVAAHEIRGPITSMHLAVQTLQRGLKPELMPRALDVIEREDRRLARFVDELLDVGRMRSGRLELTIEPVDLAAVARTVASRLAPELARAGSTLTLACDAAVVGQWDSFRLDQVVTNLLGNAIKFGRGKPISVSVSERDGSAVLEVVDHGIGIAPEVMDHIFLPFERGVSVRNYGGLGLGLHIARTLVEALGGTIVAYSELGEGSRFVVELPRGRGDG
jgi:signal transduction histidine kinase/PAS domain-containing protein